MGRLMILMLLSVSVYAQQKITLRDLTLTVPLEWTALSKKEFSSNFVNELNYEWYYENGAIVSDRANYTISPYIIYQYYEIPDMYTLRFDTLVKTRMHANTKDFGKPDTVVVNKGRNYFYGSHTLYGKSILYAQAVAKNGTLHIQMFSDPDEVKKNLPIFENSLNSTDFKEKYFDTNAKADEHKDNAAESSKWIFIFGGIFMFGYIIRKFLLKDQPK